MSRRGLVKSIALAATMTMAWGAQADGLQIRNVTAKQRYPWNGLVDVACTVSGIVGTTNGLELAVAAVMPDSGAARKVSHFWVVKNGTNSTDYAVHTNGDYRLVWDAQADLGQARYSNMVVRVTLVDLTFVDHDKVQLWAGGPYWATTNVGADEPWEYGYYFWWGDIVGYRRENDAWVASDGSSSGFSFTPSNTPTYGKNDSTLRSEGWITADGVLAPEHDAAHVQWGGRWRMPTSQELSDLCNNCDRTWTTTNGVNGYVVRGRGAYASASIFLPAAGFGGGTSLYSSGSSGFCWSSVPGSDTYDSWYLGYHGTNYYGRIYGQSVRPVQGFTE